MAVRTARHIAVGIDRPFAEVHAFLSEPANFPQWAEGLGASFRHIAGTDWHVDTPIGPMVVRFTPPNPFGVLDHTLIPPEGAPMDNPMRVVPNGDGAEVVFTLLRRPEMSEEAFAADARMIEADLRTLKSLLEGAGGGADDHAG